MQRKSRGGNDSEKQYQFESAFPMDETMQRLDEQMGHIHDGLFRIRRYKIWHDKRRGSIQFEIVRSATRSRHKLTVNGTIRDIPENRSVLERQVKRNYPIRHTALWALPLFLTFSIAVAYRGGIQLQDALLPSLVLTVIVLYVLAPKRFPALRADDIEHIENALGYHESPDQSSGKSKAKPVLD